MKARVLTAPDFITSIKTNQSHCMREVDTAGQDIDTIGGTIGDKESHTTNGNSSRQIADGQEKAVKYKKKVTLQTCPKDVEDVDRTEGLIV